MTPSKIKTRKSAIGNQQSQIPLIVVINDDGIKSPGLRAIARVLMELGEVLIVAPRDQQTSTGRSFQGGGVPERVHFEIDGMAVRAFAVASTPAVAMRYAILLLTDRPPALVVSGINYGENVGNGVTISGTIGAALEAAAIKFPVLAVSQSVDAVYHHSHSEAIDFTVAADWGKRFARRILKRGMPRGADIVNLNVPEGATLRTPLRWTKVSRMNYYRSVIKETARGSVIDGYEPMLDPRDIELDSDIRAVMVDHVVSVSFLTLDLTARVSKKEIARWEK
jgi:5'-nucleotidase